MKGAKMDQKELLRKILDAEECGDLFEQDEKKKDPQFQIRVFVSNCSG